MKANNPNRSTKAAPAMPVKAEPTREYDLGEAPQSTVRLLFSEMGHTLESSRALEGLRRCKQIDMDLDAVKAAADAVIQNAERVKHFAEAARRGLVITG